MKTGKDGRILSYHQSQEWMKKIGKKRTYKNMARGEATGKAKLTKDDVLRIRSLSVLRRAYAVYLGSKYGINPSYVYHIRARKTWRWL